MKRPPTHLIAFSRSCGRRKCAGFTLLEIIVAAVIGAIILVAVYGIFQRSIKTRDYATQRMHEARLRERAAGIIRNDLRNAYFSGGVLASTMEGGAQNQKSRFPGYLRFTTTTGKNDPDQAYGDVQQVEYYIEESASSTTGVTTGNFVRALTRDLLTNVQQNADEQTLLANVQTFEVAFYDGQSWQDSWQLSDTTSTLPSAVQVRIQQAAPSERMPQPPPLEILVPMTTVPFITSSSTSFSATPSPTPVATPAPAQTPLPTPTPNRAAPTPIPSGRTAR